VRCDTQVRKETHQAVFNSILQCSVKCSVKCEVDIPYRIPAETSVGSDGSSLFEVPVHDAERCSVEFDKSALKSGN
jgi:hypothetical protein